MVAESEFYTPAGEKRTCPTYEDLAIHLENGEKAGRLIQVEPHRSRFCLPELSRTNQIELSLQPPLFS
jgi:hypothetical protein